PTCSACERPSRAAVGAAGAPRARERLSGEPMRSGTDHTRVPSPPPEGGELVPRMSRQGYAPGEVKSRRRWVAERTGVTLGHVGRCSIPTESLRGNVENPI